MCGLERFIGFVEAAKLRDEIFDDEFDAVAEAQTSGVNDVVGARPRFADQALVNRAARASRPAASILRARADHAPRRGGNEKPDLYAVASCTKVQPYNALPRYRTAAKDI